MKQIILKHKWQIVGTLVGAFAGFLYWHYIGCNSGTCPIQANWHTSSLYGGLMGFLISDMKKSKEKTADDGKV
ncbi:DUF6132 family protein [Sunxiuqinia sp. sy24]|uniref:DUF6132 family protein n=1 Tax=Sunxiuqinia sp. sy24 TaxID=3461495 RepID=UPI0040457092